MTFFLEGHVQSVMPEVAVEALANVGEVPVLLLACSLVLRQDAVDLVHLLLRLGPGRVKHLSE